MLNIAARTGRISARLCCAGQLPRHRLSRSARTFASAWDLAAPAGSSATDTPPRARQASASTSSSATSPPQAQPQNAAVVSSSASDPSNAFDSPSSGSSEVDWTTSFHGLGSEPFAKEISDVLLAPVDPEAVEIKPDGLLFMPEIKYRRILLRAFGPGGWGMHPRGEHNIGTKLVSREYALICLGRIVSIARGEQEYFDPSGIPTAMEGCKSNALMRTCKDLGIASELWDPRFISKFKAKYCTEVWAEHVATKKKRRLWRRKDDKLTYPYEEK